MRRYRITFLLTFIASIALYIATNQRQIGILLLFLALTALLSGVSLFVGGRKVRISYEIQDSCVIHRQVPVHLQVETSGGLPIGKIRLYLQYENIFFGSMRYQEIILKPGKRKKMQYELPFVSDDCGKVRVTVEKAVCLDMLGLWAKKIPVIEDEQLVIYPEITEFQIRMQSAPENKNSGDFYDAWKKGQDVTEVFDMREFQKGDSIKSIHWKLSSKLDKTIVREFGNPSNFHTLLFYYTYLDAGIEEEQWHKVENTVIGLTASISKSLLQYNHPHHVASIDHGKLSNIYVENNQAFASSLDVILSNKIERVEGKQLEQLEQINYENRFSKIIIVTGVLHEALLKKLSQQMSVTVIYVTTGDTESVEKGKNYEVVTLPLDKVEKRVHTIEI